MNKGMNKMSSSNQNWNRNSRQVALTQADTKTPLCIPIVSAHSVEWVMSNRLRLDCAFGCISYLAVFISVATDLDYN